MKRKRTKHYLACNSWDGKPCNCEQIKKLAKGIEWHLGKVKL